MSICRTLRKISKIKLIKNASDCYKVKQRYGTNAFDVLYAGDVAETVRGIPCQKWTEQTPNQHDRTPDLFPGTGLARNLSNNFVWIIDCSI
jgi:hypothetical protein